MLKRIVTGIILLAVVLACVFGLRIFSPICADLVIVFFAFVGAYEMFKSLKKGGFNVMAIPIITAIVIIYPLTYFLQTAGIFIAITIATVVAVGNIIFKREKYALQDLAASVFICIYPLGIMMLLMVMNHTVGHLLGIVLVFAIVVLTDTMAYFVGVTCKGPKLCPNISPKKTISGAVGGLIGGIMGAVLVWVLFDKFNVFSYMDARYHTPSLIAGHPYISLGIYLAIGVVCSIAAALGDLGASIIKRKIGIKDYGNIFPGHGGVMDRIDSFLFVTPAVYIMLEIIFAVTKAVQG